MNEKTRIQIEEMKRQTIGVEVEMNNITREKCRKNRRRLSSEQADTRYTADSNGYCTWSAWDTEGTRVEIPEGTSALQGPDSEKVRIGHPDSYLRRHGDSCRNLFAD